jgi:outer membrane lipoprotein carrier protein
LPVFTRIQPSGGTLAASQSGTNAMRAIRFLAVLSLLLPTAAFAGARDDLNAFTRDLKGLDGQFAQTVHDANGKLKESSSGRVALSAPRLFRWEYAKPYEQLIVADGRKVWVYDPDLSQVTVRAQGTEEQNSPLATLIDPSKLDRDFNVSEGGTQDGLEWLVLTPKQEANASFQTARLGFGANGLSKMLVVDALGQRTEISFSAWKKNPAFAKGTFSYAPAKGVDVVDAG